MAYYFSENLFALQFEDEASFGTAAAFGGSEVTFLGTRPEITMGREIEDLGLSRSKDFVKQPMVAASRHGGTFSFRVPLRGQLSTYNDPTDSLTENPEMILLKEIMGTVHTGVNDGAEIAASSTAVLYKLTTPATCDEGACYYTTTAAGTGVTSVGWATDQTGSDVTIFEDAIGIPASGEDLYGTKTYYSDGSTQPTAKTFRYKGINDNHDLRLIGCKPEGVTITLGAGSVPVAEFTYRFTSWQYQTGSGDALPAATDYVRLPPIMGANDGRLTIDGGTTGTADTTGTGGVGNFQVEITLDLIDLKSHAGLQGVSDCLVVGRNVKATFTIPHDSSNDWITSNESDWDTSLEDGTTHSLMVHVGAIVGQVFSVFIPAGVISAQAQYGPNDGLIGWSCEMTPEEYTSDTGSTAPANSCFRIAFG